MTRALKSRVPHPRGVFVFAARVGQCSPFLFLKPAPKMNCHPERRSPSRPESKDLWLFFGELRTYRGPAKSAVDPLGSPSPEGQE
jgi:hypothetical protein